MRLNIRDIIWYFMLPGIMIHEISHAFLVFIVPNVTITDFDITSHVEYEGQLTVTRSFIISYAPVLVNTVLAYSLFSYAIVTTPVVLTEFILVGMAVLFAISIGLSGIPSYQDAISPVSLMREQLFTRRFPFIVLFGLPFLIISIPVIVLSYLGDRFGTISLVFSIIWVILIIGVSMGYIDQNMIESVFNNLTQLDSI